MPYAIRRLSLGLLLIAAASAILLFADRGHRTGAAAPDATGPRRIAILQHANTSVLDEGVRGLLAGLQERGYAPGGRLAVEQFNAQGDMPTGIAIAKQLTGGRYDLIVSVSTPSLQAVANSNRESKAKHLFTIVADPYVAGVGLDRSDPLRHPAWMAGQSSFPPVEKAFTIARAMLPSLKRVGVAWNPAESNSLAFVQKGRSVARDMGIELLEANADNTSMVGDAINSLIGRDAQAIWIGGDNTVIAGIDSVIAIAKRMGIPVFTVLPGAPDRGTLFDAGPDFFQVGRLGGLQAADVLDGTDLATVPIRDVLDVVPPFLAVNTRAIDGLKEPWRAPDAVLAEANVVVDADGIHRKAATTASATPNAPLAKKWRLSLVQLNRIVDSEEGERGVLDGFKEAGLVEGRDYVKTVRNAQGDMATVSALVDASLADSDLIVTFSTPTLQAALQRVKRLPVVFNYVSDPFAAGAGTTDDKHVANVTGIYLAGAYDQMVPLIRAYLPNAKTLGTVYVPAEVNMVSQKALLEKAARAGGFELKTVAANTSSEIADATLSLLSSHVDAICQIPGNLTAAAFPNIAQAAQRARMPIFAFQSSQADSSVLTLARDYYDSGREAAKLAARVMRGESIATIPMMGLSTITVIVNKTAAARVGLATPPHVLARAQKVIG